MSRVPMARRAIASLALCVASFGAHADVSPALAADLVARDASEKVVDDFAGSLERSHPHRVVRKAERALPLARADAPAAFWYTHEGRRFSSDDYLERQRVTGLLVLRDGRIELERYRHGRSETTRFLSASMAKSVVGLLVGIAVEEGAIRSMDDLAERYVPALSGHPYGKTSIRHLLQMSSGVRFAERYDGQDDLARLIDATIGQRSPGGAAVLLPFRERRVDAGSMFYYSSADTQVLGLVLRGATGMTVADYLSTRLWQPMGAEDDATWLVDAGGQEAVFAFLHARLRDFARLGRLVADEGRAGGRQLVPAAWVRQSTESAGAHAQPFVASAYFGYGQQFWVFPGSPRRFAFLGVRGQAIFVDPALKLVLVQTAVWNSAGDRAARAELLALWRGIVEQYGAW
ncbi:MAG TPA: serine hydrolase [Caldimonas sp.]|jgi:CubicO group peptidase (beta-lactamase class C family)|nr:serine hydrolase [Caldimonas sp.]HEX2541191.1 serine hydrolase [Caldimonas sp.]